MNFQYNKINRIILFAGSFLLKELIPFIKNNKNFEFIIFTNSRYLNEQLPDISLKKYLEKYHIDYYITQDINKDKRLIKLINNFTLGIAMGSWKFSKATATKFSKYHLLDFMSIDLPRYRGGAHHSWRILHQNRTGSINMQLIHGGSSTFQKGEIIYKTKFTFPKSLNKTCEYYRYSLRQEALFFKDFLKRLSMKKIFKLSKIDEAESSYYPFLNTKINGLINWQWQAKDIYLFINAFDDPYMGASTLLANKIVYLKNCNLLKSQEKYHPFTSGLIIRIDNTGVYTAANGGLLRIKEIYDKNGKNIIDRINLGNRFFTPNNLLERALTFKAEYGNKGLKV